MVMNPIERFQEHENISRIRDRVLEIYGGDPDILFLFTLNSRLKHENARLKNEVDSYKGQLQGLHKFIESKKLMENV